jgi:hypothetical protein
MNVHASLGTGAWSHGRQSALEQLYYTTVLTVNMFLVFTFDWLLTCSIFLCFSYMIL